MTPESVARLVLALLVDRSPTLGAGRMVAVDGPAGSGKTTLGDALADLAGTTGSVALLHMDDLYEGWTGLDHDLSDRVRAGILEPLAAGRAGRYRRYDWAAGRFAEEHLVDPVDLLVLEGVGSAAAAYDAFLTVRVWVEAPAGLRLARGIERGGEAMRVEWLAWTDREAAHFAAEGTRARADLVVDGTGRSEPVAQARRV
jgi:uridine kinase